MSATAARADLEEIARRRPTIVRVPIARVATGSAELRARPDSSSELVDQVRFGERLSVLSRGGRWVAVQAREDHYFGWIAGDAFVETDEVPEAAVVAVLLAAVRVAPEADAAVVDRLVAGTWLRVEPAEAGFVRVPRGYVAERDLALAKDLPPRVPRADDVLAAARAFLDVPYLWGGTSALGIDCSGLAQASYRLCGILLPRDADQQATAGRAVTEAAPADLVFFGSPVTHVGIALGEGRMINAPQSGEFVREQELGERAAPSGTRRYLPSLHSPEHGRAVAGRSRALR